MSESKQTEDQYFTEQQTPFRRLGLRVKELLHEEQTDYQALKVWQTTDLGRMLTLDDLVQLTEADDFTYHEMMAHVPLTMHPAPRRCLVIGGGDGGVVTEVMRHPEVERCTLVDIDEAVIRAGKTWFPRVSSGYQDPRAEIIVGDGILHVREHVDTYDAIMCDSTDPIGPAVGLFATDFYRSVYASMKSPGVFNQQVGSPFYAAEFIRQTVAVARSVFDSVHLYVGAVPTYPGGYWCYLLGTKGQIDLRPDLARAAAVQGKYYSAGVHQGAFQLPPFVAALLSARA